MEWPWLLRELEVETAAKWVGGEGKEALSFSSGLQFLKRGTGYVSFDHCLLAVPKRATEMHVRGTAVARAFR